MTRKKTSISINLLSVLIILMSVFIGIVGQTNSWFTASHENGVQIIVNVGDLKLNLYQKIGSNENIVYSYAENDKETTTEKKYITLSQAILPDEQVDLQLILKNEDLGSASMYLRFKFELFACGADSDRLIPTELIGVDEGFILREEILNDVNSGYYYYSEDGTTCGLFKQNTEGVNLMTDFVVNYEDMFSDSGELLNIASETLYVKLTVDASVNSWLSDGEI